MKNQSVLLFVLAFLLGPWALRAQVEHNHEVLFSNQNQSLFGPGNAEVLSKYFRMLKDNGQEAAFFAPIELGDVLDLEDFGQYGFEFNTKFGINFDLYARYKINSGSASIEYPVKVNFTVPAASTFGCSEEVTIKTGFSMKDESDYKLDVEEPQAEFAVGAEFDQGFYFGGRVCFVECANFPETDIGSPSFKFADNNNWRNRLKQGEYDFFRISSSQGIQFPWDLYGSIPNPGLPNLSLPLNTDDYPIIENVAKLSGTFDNPLNGADGPDELTDDVLANRTDYPFMHAEFDPLQFQQYFTGIPLTFSFSAGPFSAEFALISIPLILDGTMDIDFVFDPNIVTDLNMGQIVEWREMDGAAEVRAGTSQIIENFKLGHDLKVKYPNNQQMSISPTLKIDNQFHSRLELDFDVSLGIRVMKGNISMDGITEDDPGINIPFAVVDEEIPLTDFSIEVFDSTFTMGGFSNKQLPPFTLTPDMTPPVLTTRNITAYIPDAGGPAIIAPQDVVLTAVDQHGGTIRYLSVSPNAFECSQLGPNAVTVTIDDSRCNPTSGNAIVTVVDRTKPQVNCKSITIYLDDQGKASIQPNDVFLNGWDNCGTVTPQSLSIQNYNCSNLGANTTTLTVNDGNGNTNTCNATITVVDNKPPVMVCKPFTAYLDENGQAPVNVNNVIQTATDNCGTVNFTTVFPIVYNCAQIGQYNIVVAANDGHGNNASCTATVTVVDAIPPTVVCKYKVEAVLNANGQASITPVMVFESGADNCGQVNLQSVVPSTFNCSNLGANLVTLTVNDGHGNTGTCQMNTLSVVDITRPTVLCRNVTLTLDANGQATLQLSQVNNGSFDNCAITSMDLSQTAFTCEHLGTNTVILRGFDQSLNENQCTATITVRDLTAPAVKCKNVTLDLGADGTLLVPVASVNDGSTDNCAFNLEVAAGNLNCSHVGIPQAVTLRATDGSGNSSVCTAMVTVRDVTPPTTLCKNPTIFLDDEGQATLSINEVNNGSSDACGIAQFRLGQEHFDCSKIQGSPRPVLMTVTDIHGNQGSCIANVTVRDAIAPTAICENTTVHLGANGTVTVHGAALAGESYDNCSVWSYAPVSRVYTAANIGTNNLIIKVRDWSQNAATCVSVVTVLPNNNGLLDGAAGREQTTEDIPTDGAVSVYPNPVGSGEVNVRFDLEEAAPCTIRAFDTSGRLVFQRQGDGLKGENIIPITLQGVAAGIYLLDIEAGKIKTTRRLVVE
jgi:hypothetical protein